LDSPGVPFRQIRLQGEVSASSLEKSEDGNSINAIANNAVDELIPQAYSTDDSTIQEGKVKIEYQVHNNAEANIDTKEDSQGFKDHERAKGMNNNRQDYKSTSVASESEDTENMKTKDEVFPLNSSRVRSPNNSTVGTKSIVELKNALQQAKQASNLAQQARIQVNLIARNATWYYLTMSFISGRKGFL